MIENLDNEHLRKAFGALGDRVAMRTEIVIGGAGALILTGDLQRATSDCDVLYANPDMGRLQEDIRVINRKMNSPSPAWSSHGSGSSISPAVSTWEAGLTKPVLDQGNHGSH